MFHQAYLSRERALQGRPAPTADDVRQAIRAVRAVSTRLFPEEPARGASEVLEALGLTDHALAVTGLAGDDPPARPPSTSARRVEAVERA